MAFDPGLVARVADALEALAERGTRQRHVFGGRGFLLGKSTFAIVFGDALIVKVAPDDYQAALAAPGITPFAPDGGRPMGSWVVVPSDAIADDPELADWVRRGLGAVR